MGSQQQLLLGLGSSASSNTYMASAPQEVSVTINSGSTSGTATITGVGANAFVLYQGTNTNQSASNSYKSIHGYLQLTNSTTVTATRDSSNSDTLTIKGIVIDPTAALVQSVQQGTISLAGGATSNTATITSVNTARSVVFCLGLKSNSASNSAFAFETGLVLTNGTTVTATNANNADDIVVGYVVVQFAAGVINSLQKVSSSFTNNNAVSNHTISAVTMANTFLAYGGLETDTSDQNADGYLSLTSTTNVSYTVLQANTNTRTPYYTVVEFVGGVLNSLQRGNITLNSVTSNTATITSVNTAKAFSNFTGRTIDNGGFNNTTLSAEVLTNATTVTANKTSATSNEGVKIGYEVVEFV